MQSVLLLMGAAAWAGPPPDWNGSPINPNPPFTPTCTAGWPVSYAWIPDGGGSSGQFYEDEALLCEEKIDSCTTEDPCDIPDCGPYTRGWESRKRRTMKVGTTAEWEGFGGSFSTEFWTELSLNKSATGARKGPYPCHTCATCGEEWCRRWPLVYYTRWNYSQKFLQRYQFVPIQFSSRGYWVKCPGCSVKEVVLLDDPWPIFMSETGLSWEPDRMTAAEYCARRGGGGGIGGGGGGTTPEPDPGLDTPLTPN